jgi:hypothetical protein
VSRASLAGVDRGAASDEFLLFYFILFFIFFLYADWHSWWRLEAPFNFI